MYTNYNILKMIDTSLHNLIILQSGNDLTWMKNGLF